MIHSEELTISRTVGNLDYIVRSVSSLHAGSETRLGLDCEQTIGRGNLPKNLLGVDLLNLLEPILDIEALGRPLLARVGHSVAACLASSRVDDPTTRHFFTVLF